MEFTFVEWLCIIVILASVYFTGFYFGKKEGKKLGFMNGWNSATEFYDGEIIISIDKPFEEEEL